MTATFRSSRLMRIIRRRGSRRAVGAAASRASIRPAGGSTVRPWS